MPKGKGRKGGRVPANLGRSLINKHQRQLANPKRSQFYAGIHCTDADTDNGAGRLASVVHRNEMDEFLCNALLAERDFTAEHPNPVIIMNHDRSLDAKEAQDGDDDDGDYDDVGDGDEVVEEEADQDDDEDDDHIVGQASADIRPVAPDVQIVDANQLKFSESSNYADLPIPRRPKWDASTTADELDRKEREAFLQWRRSLNRMEEESSLTVTPFEKNLEVWRQLWRVLERSDMVAQIVDARDPLLFRCADLARVAKETDPHKTVMLVVNKSDLLTPYMRKVWADYFAANKIEFVFFSAYHSQQKIDAQDAASAAAAASSALPASAAAPKSAAASLSPIPKAAHGTGDGANGTHAGDDDDDDDREIRPAVALDVLQDADDGDAKQDEKDDDEDDDDDDDDEQEEDNAGDAKHAANGRAHKQPAAAAANKHSVPAASSAVAAAAPVAAATPVVPSQPAAAADDNKSATSNSQSGNKAGRHDAEEEEEDFSSDPATHVLGREELLDYFMQKYQIQLAASNNTYVPIAARKADGKDGQKSPHITVGMVGYPNVGKSSTINVLMGKKKVSVGATPGKTKHFQTLFLSNELCLCDCPGLVFPTFMASAAELVISGILPIDQTRDYITPVRLLCRRLYPVQFYLQYGLRFPGDRPGLVDADRLLTEHATMRGFFKDAGRPDDSRSARQILKDYVAGKLLSCNPPPSLSGDQRSRYVRETLIAAVSNAYGGLPPLPQDASGASANGANGPVAPGRRGLHDLDSLTAAAAAAAAQAAANPLDKFDEVYLASNAAPQKPAKPLSKKKERRKMLQLKKMGRRTKGKTRNMVPNDLDMASVQAVTIGAMGQQAMPGAISRLGPRPVPGAAS